MRRTGVTLPLPLSVEPHQRPGHVRKSGGEGSQEQCGGKGHGEVCRLVGPIDGSDERRGEEVQRPCRHRWGHAVSWRRCQTGTMPTRLQERCGLNTP
jgi:hypothetical protein